MRRAAKSRDAATLNWTPRFKNAGQRRAIANSGMNREADRALFAMRTIDRFLAAGGDAQDAYVTCLAVHGRTEPASGSGAARNPNRKPPRGPAGFGWYLLCSGAFAACLVGTGMFASGWLMPSRHHAVTGKVWLERMPLGSAELKFHQVGRDDPQAVVTAADGRFQLAGVAAGNYRVTVHPSSNSSTAAIANSYTKAESTPFQLHVNRDVASLQLHTHKVVPEARKATWIPGVD